MNDPRTFNLPPGVTQDDIDPRDEHEDDAYERELEKGDHENDIERNDV